MIDTTQYDRARIINARHHWRAWARRHPVLGFLAARIPVVRRNFLPM